MSIVNYREIKDRFTHIDAEFDSCGFAVPGNRDRYAVRFYPWWEHPLVIAAQREGRFWRITGEAQEREVTVTVFTQHTRAFHISVNDEITDWAFLEEHPLLWTYENRIDVTCNSKLTLEQVMGLVEVVRVETEGWHSPFEYLNFGKGLPQFIEWASQGVFSLGTFPLSLLPPVYAYMKSCAARLYPANPPERQTEAGPKLLLLDGTDYIIADDFEVDVPEIVHRPEWFSGTPRG